MSAVSLLHTHTRVHICALECLAVSGQYTGKALSHGFLFYDPQSRATFCFQSVKIQASPRPHVSLFRGPSVCFSCSAPSAATCVLTCIPHSPRSGAAEAAIFGRTSGTGYSDQPSTTAAQNRLSDAGARPAFEEGVKRCPRSVGPACLCATRIGEVEGERTFGVRGSWDGGREWSRKASQGPALQI